MANAACYVVACGHDQKFTVEYSTRVTPHRDAVCVYYGMRLTQLYADEANAETEAKKKALQAESSALERLFEQRCISDKK